jgi:hypothetical protein
MLLKTTSEVLEIDLAGAADPEMHTFISYVDVSRLNGTEKLGSQDGTSADTTDTTILAAPGADTDRVVKQIMVFNDDNASATITIQLNDGSALKTLFRAATAAGDLIQWTPNSGWQVISSTGYLTMTPHA